MTTLIPPPDPHPKFIDPSLRLEDDTIAEILSLYDEAVGFYLLVSGWLQIIVPPNFEYEHAMSHRPRYFGGLRISYISESTVLCTRSSGEPLVPQQTSNSTTSASELSVMPQALPSFSVRANSGRRKPGASLLGMTLGSTVHAEVVGKKTKERFEAAVGLMTNSHDESYLVIPTHTVTTLLQALRYEFASVDQCMGDVNITPSNSSNSLGPITITFDPEAKTFPVGYQHDVSLVNVTRAQQEIIAGIKSPIRAEWIQQGDWQELKYRTSNLHLLANITESIGTQAGVKTIGILESQIQAVGQAIFRLRRPPSAFKFPFERQKSPLQDPQTWKSLVSRSLLFRVDSDIFPAGVPSGTAICTVENGDGGTPCAKVAGFTAFAQEVTANQNFQVDGPRFYDRLEKGRIAFFGAFEVPDELRENHVIM